jgi:hypothetical protein
MGDTGPRDWNDDLSLREDSREGVRSCGAGLAEDRWMVGWLGASEAGVRGV